MHGTLRTERVAPRGRRGRRRGAKRGIHDLAGLVEQMQSVVEERDRLRAAVDQIRAVVKTLR